MLRTVWLKLLIVLALLLPAAALGHERPATSGLQSLPGRLVVLRASPHVSLTRVPPRFPPGRARADGDDQRDIHRLLARRPGGIPVRRRYLVGPDQLVGAD